jgi:hypothetical protein
VRTAAEPPPESTAIDSTATGKPQKHLNDSCPDTTPTDGVEEERSGATLERCPKDDDVTEGTATQSRDNKTSLPISNSMAEGTVDNPITVEDDVDTDGKTSLRDLANNQKAEMEETYNLLKGLLNAYSAGTKTKRPSAVPAKRSFESFSASHESDEQAKIQGYLNEQNSWNEKI